MRRSSITVIVVFMGFMLMNIQANVVNPVSADPSEHYPYQPTDVTIMNALGYLRNQQARDGSIGGFSVSAWAAMAISAAEEDPHTWGDLVGYLRENVDLLDDNIATDWERQTLAIVACNENPRDFGGMDYVAKVESFYDGMQIGSRANVYDDFFGILALVSGGVDKNSSMIQTVRIYIKEKQNENGGWGDVDSTAAAIIALMTAGEAPTSKSITDALSFIKTMQTENGGFQSWGTANAASTAWAVDAIVAAGEDPANSEWINSGNSPVDFLLGLQQENGCFNWTVDQTMNPEWMTSYLIPALLGKPYPVKIYKAGNGGSGNNNGDENPSGNNNGNDDNGNGVSNDYQDSSWNGDIRIEGKNNTIWDGKVTVSNSTITAQNSSSGVMEQYYIPYPSVLGALDMAAKQSGFSYFVIYYPSWHAFYIKTIANESDWWHYWVDYTLPMVDVGSYTLTNNDTDVLFGYFENWSAHALRIAVQKHTMNESEDFTVRVYNETMSPVGDANVSVNSMMYMTDNNGTVTLHIDTAGDYGIYAEKAGYVRSEKLVVHVKKIITIIKPEDHALYLLNRKTGLRIQKILIIGSIDIEVHTTDNVEKVEFFVGDTLKYIDTERPFTWRLNERAFFKKTTIEVKAYIATEKTHNDNVSLQIHRIIENITSISGNHFVRTSAFLHLLESYLKNLGTESHTDEKEVILFNCFPRLHG